MTVAEQVISVFCGVKGYLDDVELKILLSSNLRLLKNVNLKNQKF